MESPGKYEENETNRDLLQLTVLKLQFEKKKNSKMKVANLSFTLIFVVILSFELFLSQNYNF